MIGYDVVIVAVADETDETVGAVNVKGPRLHRWKRRADEEIFVDVRRVVSDFTIDQRSAVLVPHVTGLLDEDRFGWIGVVRDPKELGRSFAFDVVGERDETAIRHADAACPL